MFTLFIYVLTHYFQCALFPMKFSSKNAYDQHQCSPCNPDTPCWSLQRSKLIAARRSNPIWCCTSFTTEWWATLVPAMRSMLNNRDSSARNISCVFNISCIFCIFCIFWDHDRLSRSTGEKNAFYRVGAIGLYHWLFCTFCAFFIFCIYRINMHTWQILHNVHNAVMCILI